MERERGRRGKEATFFHFSNKSEFTGFLFLLIAVEFMKIYYKVEPALCKVSTAEME